MPEKTLLKTNCNRLVFSELQHVLIDIDPQILLKRQICLLGSIANRSLTMAKGQCCSYPQTLPGLKPYTKSNGMRY